MEGLYAASRDIYENQQFAPSPGSHTYVEISAPQSSNDGHVFHHTELPISELLPRLQHPTKEDGTTPTFRLVGMTMTRDHILQTDRETLDTVCNHFGVNPYFLGMLTSNIMGYHQFLPSASLAPLCPPPPSASPHRGSSILSVATTAASITPTASKLCSSAIGTFLLSNVSYAILWTQNFTSSTTACPITSAILIARGTTGKTATRELLHHLRLQRSLAPHPHLLPFVASIQLHAFASACVRIQIAAIRSVEREKGVNLWGPELGGSLDIVHEAHSRSEMNNMMSKALVELEDMLRHLKFAQSLQMMILGDKGAKVVKMCWEGARTEKGNRASFGHNGTPPDVETDGHDTSDEDLPRLGKIQSARSSNKLKHRRRENSNALMNQISLNTSIMHSTLTFLLPQIRSGILATAFLQRRARNQITVINTMIAQTDARAGIEVAMTGTEVARRAGEDASSMKVIAVVTMLFLPAMYYAELFALPSSGGGGYWAYAISTTLVVFAMWFLLTKTHVISRLKTKIGIGAQGSTRRNETRNAEEGMASGDTTVSRGLSTRRAFDIRRLVPATIVSLGMDWETGASETEIETSMTANQVHVEGITPVRMRQGAQQRRHF